METLTHHKNLGLISDLVIGEEKTSFYSEEKNKEFTLLNSMCQGLFITENEYNEIQNKKEIAKIEESQIIYDNSASNWLEEKNKENSRKLMSIR
jgi:hypothetical protein